MSVCPKTNGWCDHLISFWCLWSALETVVDRVRWVTYCQRSTVHIYIYIKGMVAGFFKREVWNLKKKKMTTDQSVLPPPIWAESRDCQSAALCSPLQGSLEYWAVEGVGGDGSGSQQIAEPGVGPGIWVNPDHMVRIFSKHGPAEWCQPTVGFSPLSTENGSQKCRTNYIPVIYRKSMSKKALAIFLL